MVIMMKNKKNKIPVCKECKQKMLEVTHPIVDNLVYVWNSKTHRYEHGYNENLDDQDNMLYCKNCHTQIDDDVDFDVDW